LWPELFESETPDLESLPWFRLVLVFRSIKGG
jgi:hypothetical protein